MDDLERFWDSVFSEDLDRIAEASAPLRPDERASLVAHLRSITVDPDRLRDQRRAASFALTALGQGPRIVLASGSPRRRELIALLGLPVSTTPAAIDEVALPHEEPAALVTRLSREKADVARSNLQPPTSNLQRPTSNVHPPTASRPLILISADTTVSLDGDILGKPADAAEARSMLTRLRGRSHQVLTAVTLVAPNTGPPVADQWITDLASTDVPMRDFSDAEMEAYVATGDPFDKAGSYAIQHAGFNPVSNLSGCYANVVGLPLCHVTRSLRALGVEPPLDVPAACQKHLRYECPVFQQILSESDRRQDQ